MTEPTARGAAGRDEGGGTEGPPPTGAVPTAEAAEEPVEGGAGAAPEPEPPADRPSAGPHLLRPIDALEHLERQWVTHRTPAEWHGPLAVLALTVPEDPDGFDYLGALTGAPAHEVAATYTTWLRAQLAADVLRLGRTARPIVELVPVGRLWYVVRSVPQVLAVLDGPGYPSPRAALRAARLRYLATLEAERREAPEAAAVEPGAAPDHGGTDEPAPRAAAGPAAPAGATP